MATIVMDFNFEKAPVSFYAFLNWISIERSSSSPQDDRILEVLRSYSFRLKLLAMIVNFKFEHHRWYNPNKPDSLNQMFLKWKKRSCKKLIFWNSMGAHPGTNFWQDFQITVSIPHNFECLKILPSQITMELSQYYCVN